MIARLRTLWADRSGLALVEFAVSAPLFLIATLSALELANFATTITRLSALSTQVADNAARIGTGPPLGIKVIDEAQIQDVLRGAELQAGTLNIGGTYDENGTTRAKARVIISQLEPVANPNTTNRYKIAWQRCIGQATEFLPAYGVQGATDLTGMGPAGREVGAPDGTAVIFVEIYYRYAPLVLGIFDIGRFTQLSSVASMIVRDSRDLSRVDPVPGVTASTC